MVVWSLRLRAALHATNSTVEWFDGRLRDELLNRENFCTLQEAHVLIEGQREE